MEISQRSETMKLLRWILMNATFAILIYFGFFGEIEGAYNTALFIAWVIIIMSFFLLSDDAIKRLKENEIKRSVPNWVDITFDITVSLVFAWFGAWLTAAFYFVHMLIQQDAWDKIEK